MRGLLVLLLLAAAGCASMWDAALATAPAVVGGAVGAVIGGPVGAAVGAGVGGFIGCQDELAEADSNHQGQPAPGWLIEVRWLVALMVGGLLAVLIANRAPWIGDVLSAWRARRRGRRRLRAAS